MVRSRGLRQGARPELPELRRCPPAQGSREHGAHRLPVLRLAARLRRPEGSGPVLQVRRPREALGRPVQARARARGRGHAPRPQVRDPRRGPEDNLLRRRELLLDGVPAERGNVRGLPLARGIERPLHAPRARARGRGHGRAARGRLPRQLLPHLLAQPGARRRRPRRVLLGRQDRRDHRGHGLHQAAAHALEGESEEGDRVDRGRVRPSPGDRRRLRAEGTAPAAGGRRRLPAVAAREDEPSLVENGVAAVARLDRRLTSSRSCSRRTPSSTTRRSISRTRSA